MGTVCSYNFYLYLLSKKIFRKKQQPKKVIVNSATKAEEVVILNTET